MSLTGLARPLDLSTQPAVARRQLQEMLSGAHWPGNVDGVLLAVHEALVNAQRHGGGASRAMACFDGESLLVEVWDRGGGFRIPRSKSVPDALAERGRGLFLMRRLATQVRVARAGREVGLRLTFDPGSRQDGTGEPLIR